MLPAPPPEDDPTRCRLLGPTALVVQGMMGVFVLLSLVVKRQLEKRKRPWRIWIWDVGKQLVGQAVIHGLNLLISDLVAHAADGNPCSLYFLNVLIDTTVGVAIFYFALKGFTWYFAVYLGLEGYVSGQYGHPPQVRFWWSQLAPYLLSIITMKLLVLLPLTLPGISTALLGLGHALLDYLSPRVQVIFVMALFPLVMNVIQFCLVDQFIKASASVLGVEGKLENGSTHGDDGGADDLDEEDDDGGYRRLPTGELDLEDGNGNGIGRSGFVSAAASGSGNGTSEGIGREARRRSSVKDVTYFSTPVLPNSPLLLPTPNSLAVDPHTHSHNHSRSSSTQIPDYGSTSPRPSFGDSKSPRGEVTPLSEVERTKGKASEKFWSKILGKERIAAGDYEGEDDRIGTTISSASTSTRPNYRSSAPSPDSTNPQNSTSPFTLTSSDHEDQDEEEDIPRIDLTSSTPLPPSTTFSAISNFSQSSGSGLTDGIRQQARRDLSPQSEHFPGFGEAGDWDGTGQTTGSGRSGKKVKTDQWKLEEVGR